MPRQFTCEHCGAACVADPKNPRQRFCGRSCATLSRPPAVPRRPLEERFWTKVQKMPGATACWLWIGSHDGRGYGTINPGGCNESPLKAPRVALEWALGRPLGVGMNACHKCDTPACVRNDGEQGHLFEGTQAENAADMVAKGRSTSGRPSPVRGERHVLAKLTDRTIREVEARLATGAALAALAREYGVSRTALRYAITRKTWKHL